MTDEVQPRVWVGGYKYDAVSWVWVRAGFGSWRLIRRLDPGDVFVSGFQPEPTEPPGDVIEECKEVDW